ncbi:hypothetical protein PC123_g17090 [Phytophthora cactorum]|nr:hypothetical protein PC123_g17090 [Phytophthora cactorum]
MADYLSPSAEIVHSPLFESAIMKLQNELPLPTDERRAVEGFVQPPSAPQVDPAKKADFATFVLRDRVLQARGRVVGPLTSLCSPNKQHMQETLLWMQACLDFAACFDATSKLRNVYVSTY